MKAIILAAGMGTRLAPMTLLKPKPLLEIRGIALLENMIKHLQAGGVNDIIVVTGYKSELFTPYAKRLGFKQITYSDYATKNSAASLKLVIDEMQKGSIILNGDLYLTESFFQYIKPNVSQFIAQTITNNVISWGYITDSNFKIQDIDTNATSGYGDGIAVFDNEKDIEIFKQELEKCSDDEYWEYCVLRSLTKIDCYAFHHNTYVEIDSFQDALYHDLLTPEDIAVQCSDDSHIQRLGGITNINYKITFLGQEKVIRIPRKGIENIVNRDSEKEIISLLQNTDITTQCEFYDSNIKLSTFLNDYRILTFEDIKNKEKIFPLIVEKLKKLHSFTFKDYPTFQSISMVGEIVKFEKLAKIPLLTQQEHKLLLNIARKMDKDISVLCHRDLQLPNIMYNGCEVKFIDFEYAGFCSIAWEIGNLSAELELNKDEILYFISLYDKITYLEVIEGQLLSNYIWALWGFIYNRIDVARNYIKRLDSNLAILQSQEMEFS
ncbi:hypothetical protein CQA53_01180 [Helicobacter didelphidarum]|uniref:Nucleotidyl transferase domain-containing protein n=1 Tax=Helicobacter didelphidarum TaxID=2040648 RepID=A0A3D8IRV7_9HELI|nr:sugar phosphate nucleotidyltransferase [Helicobacter didelphidarum]RDU67645.1 hypothetical protein CQA53_01180 [Helicobacter didelphidarum]